MINHTIEYMDVVKARAAELGCTVVAAAEDVVMCHRSDGTFITWRVMVRGEQAQFISGCYDMDADGAQSNFIERAWSIGL